MSAQNIEGFFSISIRENLKNAINNKYSGQCTLEQLLVELHRLHGEYAASHFAALLKFFMNGSIKKERLEFNEWLDISLSVITEPAPETHDYINGRMFLYSVVLTAASVLFSKEEGDFRNLLVVVPPELEDEFLSASGNLLTELEKEIERSPGKPKGGGINIIRILTEYGSSLRGYVLSLDKKKNDKDTEGDIEDLYNWDDMPSDDDLLSRDALAGYLAKRIRHVYRNKTYNESFFIHIDGKWGSGKSTFLRFLKKHLKAGDWNDTTDFEKRPWIVAEFNAWQNQRLDPPWWSILQTVYLTALADLRKKKKGLAFNLWLREQVWRLDKGRNFIISAIITLAITIVAVSTGNFDKSTFQNSRIANLILGISGLIGFIWSCTGIIRKSLITGGAKSAREFIDESSKDPMKEIEQHFNRILQRIEYPLAIFIDDLDRCNKDYGIQLLEGLQTIFKNSRVVYVIAADRNWISAMYENNYEVFSGAVSQPGKAFGMIFMDKIFQLVVELPEISRTLKISYWDSLLGIGKQKGREKLQQAEAAAEKTMASLKNKNNKEIINAVENEKDTLTAQKLREKALGMISVAMEDKYLEHKLQKYINLIDNNPRSMKRVINTLSMERAIQLLSNKKVKDEELILWTILKMQYPLVSEYIWKYPKVLDMNDILECNDIDECVKKFPGISQPDKDFVMLFKDSTIRNLLSHATDSHTIKITERFVQSMKDGIEEGTKKEAVSDKVPA